MQPDRSRRDEPPEVQRDAVSVFHGATFVVSDRAGDIVPGTLTGLFHDDTRHLSRFELRLGEQPMRALTSGQTDPYEARFFLTNTETPSLAPESLSVERRRRLLDGMQELVTVHNHANTPVTCTLELDVEADFADVFEVKDSSLHKHGSYAMAHDPSSQSMTFAYDHAPFAARTQIRFSIDPMFHGNRAVFALEIPARGRASLTIDVSWSGDRRETAETHDVPERARRSGWDAPGEAVAWRKERPQLETDSEVLRRVWERSLIDLTALRLEIDVDGTTAMLPAAGLPWFMAAFGRDTLITSYQSLLVAPDLARGALHLLASLQGDERDDFRDEEPGKIMHELRHGELTVRGDLPYRPYYGSVDATPLWLILLSEYHRVTGDDDSVRELWINVRLALDWIGSNRREYGGFLNYRTRSPRGLENQGWKDSGHGVLFRDGSTAARPIAICEAQGYVFDALDRVADLAESVVNDPQLAADLRRDRDDLRRRFDDAFWVDDRGGHYALGLDGNGRRIDSLTSNVGHLLWSGIVPPQRAGALVERLFSDDLWSGWGVRTAAQSDGGFSPLGYHTGTVWAHDNSLISAGLHRYGYREEANRIAIAMLEAAERRGYRLPEAFAGYARGETEFPVRYPTASDPQAWATAAPFLWVRSMLGLDVRGGTLTLDPVLPTEIASVRLRGLYAAGRRWDVDVAPGEEPSVSERAGSAPGQAPTRS
jgi:glycogen debranching enzyme